MQDFEVDALIPCFISSVTAYSVFSSVYGFSRIFDTPQYTFTNPLNLFFYAALGLLIAPFIIGYIRTFYWFKNKAFKRMNVTNYLKPAIGGLALGLSTIFLPQVLGGGYGWVQLAIYGQIGLMTMLSIGLLKIIATSLTIGSGGSGGVFAPSLMIGGMLGGAIGTIFNTAFPKLAPEPCAVIIIGMAAFFAGAAHVPIAAMIMVAEMTGDYGLIPAMLTCTITYLAVGKRTIYEKQVLTRVDSPAHRDEFLIDVLEQIPVSKVFTKRVDVLSPRSSVKELARLISDTGHHGFPVVEDGRVVGVVTSSDILKVPTIEAESKKVEEIISRSLYVTYPHENLALALHKMQSHNIGRLLVVDPHDQTKLLGILTKSDIIRGHEALRHKGIIKSRTDFSDRVIVEEVMNRKVITVPYDADISEFLKIACKYGYQIYPVLKEGQLVGIVDSKNLIDIMLGLSKARKVSDIIEKRVTVVYPDQTLTEAMRAIYTNKARKLLVVDRSKPDRLVGIINKTDIVMTYTLEKIE